MSNLLPDVPPHSRTVKPQPKCLHGFSFATEEERQQVAEGHHLWSAFENTYRARWCDRKPVMSDEHDRMLFEWYVEGAYQETVFSAAMLANREAK